MPLKKEKFSIVQDNMTESIDIDDSRGRSVPINMNFIETGYLTKDTGFSLLGATETSLPHSPYYYQKKDGTNYHIRILGTKLQKYNTSTELWEDTSKTVTADAMMAYVVYDDTLICSNAVDTAFIWDGTTFTDKAGIPKGNILEIFETRLYVSGVILAPRTTYYSDPADPYTFGGSALFQLLGVDNVMAMKNYYGFLVVFKEKSIWKVTLVEVTTGVFVPKQELQSNNYGACSKKAVTWVENDLWFFTGKEVRAFGFKDQQTGILGLNTSVLSEPIKETLNTIALDSLPYIACHYNNRRFYLSVPLNTITPTLNSHVFVCHTLYSNSWTKYISRDKSKASDIYDIDGTVYSIKNTTPYATLKWDEDLLDDNGTAISSSVTFKKIEDKDFNLFNIYRYLDLMFKNLQAKVTVTIYQDKSDLRTSASKAFYIGLGTEDELATIGEVDYGENLVADGFGQSPESAPFIKKRISFLAKAQSITVSLATSGLNEEFTVAQFAVYGMKQEKETSAPSSIVSIR